MLHYTRTGSWYLNARRYFVHRQSEIETNRGALARISVRASAPTPSVKGAFRRDPTVRLPSESKPWSCVESPDSRLMLRL